MRLRQPADAVHAVRQQDAVPVDRRVLRAACSSRRCAPCRPRRTRSSGRATGRCSPRGSPSCRARARARTGSAMRWNSFQPLFMRHGSDQPLSVTTGLYGRPVVGMSGGWCRACLRRRRLGQRGRPDAADDCGAKRTAPAARRKLSSFDMSSHCLPPAGRGRGAAAARSAGRMPPGDRPVSASCRSVSAIQKSRSASM